MDTPMDVCAWNVIDDAAKVMIGVGIYIAGICSILLNGWLLLAFVNRSLWSKSYIMVLHLSLVSVVRSLIGFTFIGTADSTERWIFGATYCKMFAFLKLFVGVYQMEALTHLCIERYVAVKYTKFGWHIPMKHYVHFVSLCWMFSIIYSFPTLFGVGQFTCDLTGTSCALGLVWSEDNWQPWYLTGYILLAGVKPLGVMSWMLCHADTLEKVHYNVESHEEELQLTKTVRRVTLATLCCWIPQGALLLWMVVPQLVSGVVVQPPAMLVISASLFSEIAPAVPIFVYLYTNDRIRTAMMFGKTREIKQE